LIYRAAVVFSMQSWLGESEATTQNTSTPGYFSVGMSSKPLHILPVKTATSPRTS
jgi:hypothetical protein